MYAVVSSGGKQYRVEAGSELIVERIAGEPGASVTFDRVLLIGDGDDVTVGTPTVSGASVSGTLLREELGPKLVIFKFKQKVKYRRRTGHRQHLVRVRIDEINASGKRSSRAAEPKAGAAADTAPETAPEAAPAAAKPARKPRAAASAKAPAKPKASAKADDSASAKPNAPEQAEASAGETEKPKRRTRAKATADKPAEE
jgi:large subunit ribosomal protein L21